MPKNKENKKASNSKPMGLDGVRKKNLKMVLYKNKYFHNEARSQTGLIETLLHEKKKVLKLHQSTDTDLHSEEENEIYENEITKALEQEKKSIFRNNDSDSSDSAPAEILEANEKWKEQQKQQVIFPAIPKKEMNEFLSLLSSDKKSTSYENKLHACLAHLHTPSRPFGTTPSCVMKAIKDCILRRKWNNLTQILLMLIDLRSAKLRPFVLHMCQILNKLHPVIEHNDLQNQLNMVYETYNR